MLELRRSVDSMYITGDKLLQALQRIRALQKYVHQFIFKCPPLQLLPIFLGKRCRELPKVVVVQNELFVSSIRIELPNTFERSLVTKLNYN